MHGVIVTYIKAAFLVTCMFPFFIKLDYLPEWSFRSIAATNLAASTVSTWFSPS